MQAMVIIDGKKFYSCGVRFKGESSYDFYPGKKKPFRIKFDKFIKKQNFNGLEDLNLTNNFKDPTMIREKIYLDMMNKHGLPCSTGNFCKVYVNDKYWGLYQVNENIDDVFLETRFKEKNGNLFQGDPVANFVYLGNDQSKYYMRYGLKNNEEKNDWADLVRFIKLINDTILNEEEYAQRINKVINLDALSEKLGDQQSYRQYRRLQHVLSRITSSSITTAHQQNGSGSPLDGNYSFAAWNPIMNYPQLD